MITFIQKNFKQFIKFGIVGVMNTFNSLIIYYIFLFFKVQYLIANVFAYFISSFIGYLLNRKWVFKRGDNRSGFRYYVVYISSFFLNMGCMYLLVDVIGISKYISPLLVLCVTVPYNYLFSHFWVFKAKAKYHYSHTFVICAYKESPYLEACIQSILHQKVKDKVFITTSTPNPYIKKLGKKYHLKVYETGEPSDIQNDWNFGYNLAKTDLVTIAHQDDVYHEDYLAEVLNLANQHKSFKMIQTDYMVLKNGKTGKDANSKIKRILKFPLRFQILARFKFFKVASLSFGNTVNCPSVTYHKKLLGKTVFTSRLKFSLDWDTFLKIAREKGLYLYLPKPLISYRIHDEATTKSFIVNHTRQKEDIEMFSKIWPNFIVRLIMKIYVKSYDTYN